MLACCCLQYYPYLHGDVLDRQEDEAHEEHRHRQRRLRLVLPPGAGVRMQSCRERGFACEAARRSLSLGRRNVPCQCMLGNKQLVLVVVVVLVLVLVVVVVSSSSQPQP